MEYSKKYSFCKWVILPALALITYLFTEYFSSHPEIAEKYYSQIVYWLVAQIISFFSSFVPFSIDDLFYLLLIITTILLFVLVILKKIKPARFGKIVLNLLAAVYFLFYTMWGFNYFREDLNARTGIIEQEPNSNEFISVLKKFVSNTNNSYVEFETINKIQIDSLIEVSYSNCASALQLKYPSGKKKQKILLSVNFLQKLVFLAITDPFSAKFMSIKMYCL